MTWAPTASKLDMRALVHSPLHSCSRHEFGCTHTFGTPTGTTHVAVLGYTAPAIQNLTGFSQRYHRWLKISVRVMGPIPLTQMARVFVIENINPAACFEVFSDFVVRVTNNRDTHIPCLFRFTRQRVRFTRHTVNFTTGCTDFCDHACFFIAS